jgi:hypothetical protein
MVMITKKDKAALIEGSELRMLTYLLNVSSNEWKDYSVETFLELQRIIISLQRIIIPLQAIRKSRCSGVVLITTIPRPVCT